MTPIKNIPQIPTNVWGYVSSKKIEFSSKLKRILWWKYICWVFTISSNLHIWNVPINFQKGFFIEANIYCEVMFHQKWLAFHQSPPFRLEMFLRFPQMILHQSEYIVRLCSVKSYMTFYQSFKFKARTESCVRHKNVVAFVFPFQNCVICDLTELRLGVGK